MTTPIEPKIEVGEMAISLAALAMLYAADAAISLTKAVTGLV